MRITPDYLQHAGRVIDGTGKPAAPDAAGLIRGGLIRYAGLNRYAGPARDAPCPPGTVVLEGADWEAGIEKRQGAQDVRHEKRVLQRQKCKRRLRFDSCRVGDVDVYEAPQPGPQRAA